MKKSYVVPIVVVLVVIVAMLQSRPKTTVKECIDQIDSTTTPEQLDTLNPDIANGNVYLPELIDYD